MIHLFAFCSRYDLSKVGGSTSELSDCSRQCIFPLATSHRCSRFLFLLYSTLVYPITIYVAVRLTGIQGSATCLQPMALALPEMLAPPTVSNVKPE
ncbi:hypothetical protein DPMN_146173 [Dreissena polymorpha]|uniref:Uncharacterized protein n=1 Tax=Dreissena polymorpha TaxID=45954 RepID=A0A9D4F7E5_DREPO|nr:hypothetical protein DPMN_146173 [Dreissena polymorpha]